VSETGGAVGTEPASSPPPTWSWSSWVDESCRVVEASGQWRGPRTFDAKGPAGELDGVRGTDCGQVVSFASNDYLGLASHPEVITAAHEAIDRWGTGSGASRLVTGSRPVHAELERALAAWKRSEQVVLFPTGFAANLSVLSVFATEGAHVFSDELNHASIIDGCRMGRAGVTVYPHGDLDSLDASLVGTRGRPIIVTDSVFSMDGDHAALDALVRLARHHGALLVVDEAHAVLGPELPAVTPGPDVLRVGTLSKTLGSLGGFVAGPRRMIELLVNRARPYIFTTATTPADAAAALAALGILRSGQGDALRARLTGHVARVSTALGRPYHPSPIVPVVIGDEADAVAASSELLSRGLWVPAIRPPTVPSGTSRLRITLSAIHTDDQVTRLIGGLAGLGAAGPPSPRSESRSGSRSGRDAGAP
jgi:8-amino-7-oxononanoate synthase